jgi:putative CocE/NonD family hydrolase
VLNTMPADTRHVFVMMPLRDGVRLATDLFVPPGDGSWPAVLLRTPYARWDARVYQAMEGAPCVAVMQNVRGRYGSEGAGTFPGESFDNEVNDSYDAIEWVAGQKWCNGKVGMWGPSGHGVAAAAALWSQSPHLTMADTNITGDNAYMY